MGHLAVTLPEHLDLVAPVTIYDGRGRKLRTMSAEAFRGRPLDVVETCRAHDRRGCQSCRMGSFRRSRR